jgi:hypothetical protein
MLASFQIDRSSIDSPRGPLYHRKKSISRKLISACFCRMLNRDKGASGSSHKEVGSNSQVCSFLIAFPFIARRLLVY